MSNPFNISVPSEPTTFWGQASVVDSYQSFDAFRWDPCIAFSHRTIDPASAYRDGSSVKIRSPVVTRRATNH